MRSWTILALLLSPPVLLQAQAPPQELAARELRLEIREAEERVGERIDGLETRVEEAETWFKTLATLLGVSALGLVAAYLRWLRKAGQLMDERLAALVESRPRALMALIDERDAALRQRSEAPILVIAERFETQGILLGSGFRKVTTRSTSAPDLVAELAKAPVVVFALDDGCDEDSAQGLITRHGIEFFLAYKAGRSQLQGRHATYANSPVTLFARLSELIAYRAAVERERRSPA